MPITENPGQAWSWRWRPFMTLPKWDVTKSQDFSLWEWKSINLLTKESEQKDITFSNLICFQSSIPASACYLGKMASWPEWEGHLLGSIWRMGRWRTHGGETKGHVWEEEKWVFGRSTMIGLLIEHLLCAECCISFDSAYPRIPNSSLIRSFSPQRSARAILCDCWC